ncbi:SMEK domain-containing protein [Polaribacter aquimarinus]|uniref:SMEK domain-containing protein n=1 Tax=Polaribacter aquimarinus TaxID=2100726 RepID=A0A2U2J753_9FLAO|nr:SMEK domain-containing protein [Polaribacter aquimarinus]PWG04166.1 hypothetical protein DIS07_14475 [Polaribacter aquimarinus]
MREISQEIEGLITTYFSQLRKDADNGWTNAYKKAEDFYCRFLNKVYGWNLYNRNYHKKNESDIDLATYDRNITVQVTAQKDDKKGKIERTIKGFKNRKVKQGYKSLFIAFFEDLSKSEKENDFNDNDINFSNEKNILTPSSLKAHIQSNFTYQQQLDIYGFLKQELFPQEEGVQSIAYIKPIEQAFDREDEFYSNSKFIENNWIVLSKPEFQLFKNIRRYSKSNLYEGAQNYLLVGSSCSGKTTFSYFVASMLAKQTLIKSFYLKVTEATRLSDVKKELGILNNQFSFLIIDDIQNNINFSDELFVELKNFNQIQTIFLSRNTSLIDDEFNGQIYHRKFVWKKRYNNDISCDENRIKELVQNRKRFYTQKHPDKEFEIGDFNKVLELVNFNLLKLSILLHFWGKDGGLLSDFDNEILNERFYNSYDFKNKHEIQLTLRYASVYSYNIPFQPQLPFSDANGLTVFERLKDKGLFFKEDKFFVFHHTAFADLIAQSIISQFPDLKSKGVAGVKKKQIIDYLSAIDSLPENFGTLVQNLSENGDSKIVTEIFNTPNIKSSILEYYLELNPLPFNFSNTLITLGGLTDNSLLNDLLSDREFTKRVVRYYSLKSYASQTELLKLLREHKLLEHNSKKAFLEDFESMIPFHKIRVFEQDGYHLKNEILAFKEVLGEMEIEIGQSVDNIQIKTFVKETPINELTLGIYQDRKNQKLTIQRLFVLDFSFWMEKFYSAPFCLLGNCLTELKKTDVARQLAFDIYKNLSVDLLLQSALEYKNQPVKISKSLNELINFRAFDNNQKLDELLNMLIADKRFYGKISQLSLTDFARFLSDIYDINKEVAQSIFSSRTSNEIAEKLIKDKESLYSVTQIINNLNKVSSESSKEILLKLINAESFLSNEKLTDLNGLHEFKQCLKSYNLYLSKESIETVSESTVDALLNETDLTKVAKTLPGFRKNKDVLIKVFSSNQFSVSNFMRIAKNEDFRISHLQQILPKLIDADLELGHKVYTSLSNEYFIKPSNRTYFQGVCHAIFSFVKIDKQYSNKYQVASTKTQSILKTLCTNRTSTFLRKVRNTEIDKFLNGFQQTWIVSEELTRHYLTPILIDKAKESKKENINLSTFGQGIKRLIDLDKDEHLTIAKKLFETYRPILKQTTKNLDIRKISYGLEQLSILADEVDLFAQEISEIIEDKCKIESNRDDFKTGVLPELTKALKGKNGKKIIEKVKKL